MDPSLLPVRLKPAPCLDFLLAAFGLDEEKQRPTGPFEARSSEKKEHFERECGAPE